MLVLNRLHVVIEHQASKAACDPLRIKSASLVYRSLFRQARHRAAWNCIFMNRAEAPYTAIKRECSDISP